MKLYYLNKIHIKIEINFNFLCVLESRQGVALRLGMRMV